MCQILNLFSVWPSENPIEFHHLIIYWVKRVLISISFRAAYFFFLFSKVNNARIFCWPFLILFFPCSLWFCWSLSYSPSLFSSEKSQNTCLKLQNCSKYLFIEKFFFMTLLLPIFFFILSSFSSWEKNFYTGTKLSISLNIFPSAFFFCVLFSSVFYNNALFAFMKALYFWAGFLKRPEAVTLRSFSDWQKPI